MHKDRRHLFLEGSITRALAVLAIPIIFGNIAQTGYQLTDAFWVGRLGASAVAAVSVSFPVTFLVIAMGSGLAMAGAVMTAQYAGAGRQDMVNHVAAQTILMVAITSVLLGALGYVLSPLLLRMLGVAPDVYDGALAFMRVSFIGIIFVFVYAMFQSLMRGVGQVRIPLMIVLATVALNFALDPLFIFGWGPIEGRGVVGAALATLVTQAIAAAAGIVVFVRGRHGIHIAWPHFFRIDPAYLKRAFLLGLPGSIELSTRGLGLIFMSFLVVGFGTEAIAAYGVGSTLLQVITIPAMGISMAVSTLAGQNIGANNVERASRATVLGAALSFAVLSVAGLIAFLFAPLLVAFFIPGDPQVIEVASKYVRIMCLAWGAMGVQLSITAAFRASGNMLMAMVLGIVSQWVVQFPLAFVLSRHTSLHESGIWWSFPLTNVVIALVSIAWFARGSWKTGRLTEDAVLEARVAEDAAVDEGLR